LFFLPVLGQTSWQRHCIRKLSIRSVHLSITKFVNMTF